MTPLYLVTIPIYHSVVVEAVNEDEAEESALKIPYKDWDMDDCQPDPKNLDDIDVCEV